VKNYKNDENKLREERRIKEEEEENIVKKRRVERYIIVQNEVGEQRVDFNERTSGCLISIIIGCVRSGFTQ
jgi:hypothetical protein